MKRIASLLIATVLSGPGCVTLDVNFFAPKPAPPAAKQPDPPPPQVTAAQVTEKNAAEMVDALSRELDYAAENPRPFERPAATKP